ncbi:MAG TPA: hypothetical protein VK549_16970 [Acidimicrobiia bacterium]|nr:hypothetical protein [Acidimicrobiia bacterium]
MQIVNDLICIGNRSYSKRVRDFGITTASGQRERRSTRPRSCLDGLVDEASREHN